MRQFKNPDERLIVFILLGILFIFFLVISFLQEGTYGGADDISHYNFSRNAFIYPRLILDLWGKPVFTLLSSPFAQFGMEGVIIFNIILGLFTCYLTYLIARIRQYKDPWLLILFVCFAPMYTIMIVTGMTEILFGFALVFAAYLFFKENYFASSIIISFLPFIRNEGIIIIPVYLVVYVWYKKWKAIPFLLTGILLLSCIGTLYYNDLLWILHKWPYGNTSSIYGTGNLLHYVRNASKIMGIPLIILFITGLIFSLVRFFNGFSLKPSLKLTELTLIFGPLFIYFTGYSYAWWKGMSGSGGEFRVMTPIIPFFAIYALQGINMLVSPRFINRWFKAIIYLIFLVLIIRTPFEIYQIPRHFSEPEKIIFKASQWLKQHVSGKGVIYYFDPFIQHYLDINYYDQTLIRQFLPDPVNPGEKIPEGSFIAWDAHFGATQGMVSLASLINSPSLRLVKIFKPDNYFMVLGNNYYNIFIFRKDTIVEKDYNFNQLNRLSFYNDDDIKQINIIRYLSLDTNTLTNLLDTVLAGRACTMLDTAEINSYTIKISGAEINPEFTGIRASIYYYPVEQLREESCILELSIFKDGWNRILYHSTQPYYLYNLTGAWNLMTVNASLPKGMDNLSEIIVQIRQPQHQEIYINELRVELMN